MDSSHLRVDITPRIDMDIIVISGTQREENVDHGSEDDYDDPITELNEDTDDILITDVVPKEEPPVSTELINPITGNTENETITTRSMKHDRNVLNQGKNTEVGISKNTGTVKGKKLEPDSEERYQIKVDVKTGNAEVKRVSKKGPKLLVKRRKTVAKMKDKVKVEIRTDDDDSKDKILDDSKDKAEYDSKDKTEDDSKEKTEDDNKIKVTQQRVTRTYNCTRCGEPFPSTVAHNKHLRSKLCFVKNIYNEPEELVKCMQCSFMFPRQDYLEVHKTVHEDTVPRNFTVIFVDLCEFLSNVETMDSDAEIKCDKCCQRFAEKRLLIHHTILMHSTKYECQICEQICETKYKCWAHQRLHETQPEKASNEHKKPCITCKKTFKTKSDLDRHSLLCQTGQVISYPCGQCKKLFSSEEFLSKHKENAHIKKLASNNEESIEGYSPIHDDRSYMCSFCGKIFNNRAYFHSHMNSHTGERNFECDICNKTFKTKDVLTKHKRIHDDTRPYCCDICGWGFNQSGSLRKHMDSHLKIKRHQCEVCSKKFAHKASLANHKLQCKHFVDGDEDETINVDMAKKCEYCDKLFPPNSLYMYKRHLMIHTGDKPHKCDVCDKAFSDRANLKCHRLIHLENKPFACKLCGRGFAQKRSLKRHLESSNPCTISNNIGSVKHVDIDNFEEDPTPSAFHTPNTASPDSIGPDMVAVPVTCEQNLQVNIDQNVYTSSDNCVPLHYVHTTMPNAIVNIHEPYDQNLPVSSSSQGIQGDAVLHFQGGFTGDAIATAMAIASAEDDDADIAKRVTDLTNNQGTVDSSWMFVKPWK